jgi:hypothetical protein
MIIDGLTPLIASKPTYPTLTADTTLAKAATELAENIQNAPLINEKITPGNPIIGLIGGYL